MLRFRALSCGFRVPSACREPKVETTCGRRVKVAATQIAIGTPLKTQTRQPSIPNVRASFHRRRRSASRWAFVYQPEGQTDDLRSLVMPWLPDAHGRSVRLNLIDVASFNPNRLTLHNGLLNDRRLLNNDWLSDYGGLPNHNRLGHDCRRGLNHDRLGVIRTRQRRPDHTADNSADESRPEVASARSPIPAVVVMVAAVPAVVITPVPTSMMRPAMPAMGERPSRCRHKGDCYYEFLHLICPSLFRLKLVCRRANQPADNCANCRRAKRNPSGVPATVMDVVNDLMPRRWRWAMRTMPPAMMRSGNRRTRRQNHTRHKNHECLDDLVHVTPATFCFDFPREPISRSHQVRRKRESNLTDFITLDFTSKPAKQRQFSSPFICATHHLSSNSNSWCHFPTSLFAVAIMVIVSPSECIVRFISSESPRTRTFTGPLPR